MKATLLLVLLMSAFQIFSFAQIQKIAFGVNGLTCSQCSRSVEMELRKLDFIKDITMDLEHTSATISLKNDTAAVPFNKIAQAVKDAGFSLRYIDFAASNIQQKDNNNFTSGNNHFYLLGNKAGAPKTVYRLAGKFYMDGASYKKYKPLMPAHVPKDTYLVIPGPEQ